MKTEINCEIHKIARDGETIGNSHLDKDRPCKHSNGKVCNCVGNQTCPHYYDNGDENVQRPTTTNGSS